MEENWKTLAIDNRYSISTNGNIISNVYKEPRRLHPVIDNRGYYYIRIRNKAYNVHRLVALTFIPTNDTTLHVDHIDGNKLNNHIENLRWCTQKEINNFYMDWPIIAIIVLVVLLIVVCIHYEREIRLLMVENKGLMEFIKELQSRGK